LGSIIIEVMEGAGEEALKTTEMKYEDETNRFEKDVVTGVNK